MFFYLFSCILLMSALGVVWARSTLYSVLFLITAFVNAGALMLILGAEFLAMVLIILYVGAVAVLFLFVVMMVDNSQLSAALPSYRKVKTLGAIIFGFELCFAVTQWDQSSKSLLDRVAFPIPKHLTNTQALGELLYTHFFYIFQISGLILLVAMIGKIVLTLDKNKRCSIRKQNISDQLRRKKEDTLVLKNVEFRQGTK